MLFILYNLFIWYCYLLVSRLLFDL